MDQEITELISKKATGQRKRLLLTWWKEDCCREKARSVKRWQENDLNHMKEAFKKDYRTKIPFFKMDDKATEERAQKQFPQRNEQMNRKDRPLTNTENGKMGPNTIRREVETSGHLPFLVQNLNHPKECSPITFTKPRSEVNPEPV